MIRESVCKQKAERAWGVQVMKGDNPKYVPGQGPSVPQQCAETGSSYLMGGPFWAEPLHDPDWLKGLIEIIDVRALTLLCS